MSESTIATTGTISSEASNIEGDINLATDVAAAVGGPVGGAVAVGVQGAEAITNAILASENSHATAKATTAAGIAALAQTAPAVIAATVPAADQAEATGLLEDLSAIFGKLVSCL